MTLEELLEELREGILHDQTDQVDGTTSQLWSDKRLVRYINEAQRRMARLALCLRDNSTPEVVEVSLTEGVTEYTLHRAVLAVISARFEADNKDLPRAGHSAFDTYRQPDTQFFDPAQFATIPPGKPLAFSTDESVATDSDGRTSAVNFRVYPAPSADYDGKIVRMRVARLPLCDLRLGELGASPEMPEVHHLEMLDWAGYLALRTVDVDEGMPDRAAEFRKSFEGHVEQIKREAARKMFTPLAWGFGRSGWTWEK